MPLGHTAKQAAELQPWEFLNLVRVSGELTGTLKMLALFMLQAAVSRIRFEHFGRSSFTRDHGSLLDFRWCDTACASHTTGRHTDCGLLGGGPS